MKRMLWMALPVLALSTVALASSSIDFNISSGTLGGHNSAMSVEAAAVSTIGAKGLAKVDLGSVGFSTRSLTSVSLQSSTLSGAWFNSAKSRGTSLLVAANTDKGFFAAGPAKMTSIGDPAMCHNMVPEPGTLGLLGTGLMFLAGALRLKFKA
jgi:PEP-CTERM motif-containing protein